MVGLADIFFKILGTRNFVDRGIVELTIKIEELWSVLFSAAMRLQRDDRYPNNVFRPHSMLKISSFFRSKIWPKEELMIKIREMKIRVGIFIFKGKIRENNLDTKR